MIKIEEVEVVGLEHAIRGMRNPMNSWSKSDSGYGCLGGRCEAEDDYCLNWYECYASSAEYIVGENDLELAKKLAAAGPVHAKYRRMIAIYADITAPGFWWKEWDTYKIGTVRNSCSTMHKIHVKEFVPEDFSHEGIDEVRGIAAETFTNVISTLEKLRKLFNETGEKKYWRAIIELLPAGYNVKSTVMFNYEGASGMHYWRKDHKLDEWHKFCKWLETLPYSELITGEINADT